MLLDQDIVHSLSLRQLSSRLQHAILKMQHLLERVVKERRGECDGVGRRLVQPHL